MTTEFACLILAAGNSSRFGDCKLLAEVNSVSLIERCITTANAISQHVYIVLGAYAEQIKNAIGDANHCIENPHWQQGMGSSLALGVSQLPESVNGVLILLADQVAIEQKHLLQIVNKWQQSPHKIVCAHYANSSGVPALFPRQYFSELQQLTAERGAKRLLQKYSYDIINIALPAAAFDVDRPDDLRQWPFHEE